MKLVSEVGNWKIVAHIAFKFYSVASGTFSTGSTPRFSRGALVPQIFHQDDMRAVGCKHC